MPKFTKGLKNISIFIVKLSKSKDLVNNTSYNSIFVIVKRLTKYSKFILINEFYSVKDLKNTVIRKIINNYKLLNKFVTNIGITFVLRFFIAFTVKLKINNKLSIAFYP